MIYSGKNVTYGATYSVLIPDYPSLYALWQGICPSQQGKLGGLLSRVWPNVVVVGSRNTLRNQKFHQRCVRNSRCPCYMPLLWNLQISNKILLMTLPQWSVIISRNTECNHMILASIESQEARLFNMWRCTYHLPPQPQKWPNLAKVANIRRILLLTVDVCRCSWAVI